MPLRSELVIGIEIQFIYKGKRTSSKIQKYLHSKFSTILRAHDKKYITDEFTLKLNRGEYGGQIQTIPLKYNIATLTNLKLLLYSLYVQLGCYTNSSCSIHLHISSLNMDFYQLGCLLYNFIELKRYLELGMLIINDQWIRMEDFTYSSIVKMKSKYFYQVRNKIKRNDQSPFQIIKFYKNSFCELRDQYETIEYRAIRGIFDVYLQSREQVNNRIMKYIKFIDTIVGVICNTPYNKLYTYDSCVYKQLIRHSS